MKGKAGRRAMRRPAFYLPLVDSRGSWFPPFEELPRHPISHGNSSLREVPAVDRSLLDRDSLALADEIALDIEPLAIHVPAESRTPPAMPNSKARAAERFGVDK